MSDGATHYAVCQDVAAHLVEGEGEDLGVRQEAGGQQVGLAARGAEALLLTLPPLQAQAGAAVLNLGAHSRGWVMGGRGDGGGGGETMQAFRDRVGVGVVKAPPLPSQIACTDLWPCTSPPGG